MISTGKSLLVKSSLSLQSVIAPKQMHFQWGQCQCGNGKGMQKQEDKEWTNTNFHRQATTLASIWSTVVIFEAPSGNKTLELGTAATMAYF